LGEAGLQARKPTLTMAGPVEGLMALPETAPVEITDGPDGDWAGVFLGPGFDPVDGASRLAILRRGRANVFAGVRVAGDLVAVGSACFAEGWCGVHGMRTVPAARGRGWAGAILAAFGRQAHQRGVESVFLQVEQANAPAQALYRRAGLQDAYLYDYWSR
jgi:ribosomal protein S18 acetylase RimI-like enzyme